MAVVVVSLARNRSSLAAGNIVGSAISNILGAFSLGLLFQRKDEPVFFDRTSRIYSALLLLLTTLVAGLTGLGDRINWKIAGGFVIIVFVLYVSAISWSIYRGYVSAPELSDSDSDSDEEDTDPGDIPHPTHTEREPLLNARHQASKSIAKEALNGSVDGSHKLGAERRPSIGPGTTVSTSSASTRSRRLSASASDSGSVSTRNYRHSLLYHIAMIAVGILAIILSAYVLSYASTTVVDQFGISDVLVGVVILSIATTIPEKFIAVVSGHRGQVGILVASTVGSNIFLLSLCIGVLWIATDGIYNNGFVKPVEIWVMLGSTLAMTLTVWFGAKFSRPIGAAMLIAYVVFIISEFAFIH